MRKLLILLALFVSVTLLFGQSKETCFDSLVPINPYTNQKIALEIHIFNDLMRITAFNDTIAYRFNENGTNYFYKNNQISNWNYPVDDVLKMEYVLVSNENKLLIKHVTVNEHYGLDEPNKETSFFEAYIPDGKNKWKVIKYLNQFRRRRIICSYLNEFIKDKEEKMYGCDGVLKYEHYFELIDSNHVTESHTLLTAPRMYIEQRIFHHKYSKKCGIWRTYNQDGSIKHEQIFENCK